MKKMAFNSSSFFNCIILFGFLGIAAAASVSLSDSIFESKGATGRALLQAKKSCTVDFENQNYTILTSQCRGPQYKASLCCGALKQFACPFSDEINDLTNDCASTMFSYINLYGKYPPGLFANECKEGKNGLDCRADPPVATSTKNSVNQSNAQKLITQATWVTAGIFVLLLFQLLF
ncbi:hypothetical protein SAY87_025302 [Trapa incisa]|uniref:GPI-anchored protein LLG1-like domain-containing protein n=2 Tax=Trapa TaxID=22665 RepID=A0AAN7LXP7_TRANT|nr:hypothetical protein SAY87_025302 [Trapa incisa]KAK4788047.1 hypothetical protein SAY86_019366 [Trapa natans]